MIRSEKLDEETILEKFRGLTSERKRELLDFLEFLVSRDKVQEWLEFDAWALNIAKSKRFSHLTEADVASIVRDYRSGRQ